MQQIIVPIFICVVLPVSIVLIKYLAAINKENKNAQVLIKAIESNNNVDVNRLAEALSKPRKTPQDLQSKRLKVGCVDTLVGGVIWILCIIHLCTGYSINDAEIEVSLIIGLIFLAIGVGNLIVYNVNRKKMQCQENAEEISDSQDVNLPE